MWSLACDSHWLEGSGRNCAHRPFSSVQSLSCVRLFAISWIAARQATGKSKDAKFSWLRGAQEGIFPGGDSISQGDGNNQESILGVEKSFIWAKLSILAQETASQITRCNCSREARFFSTVYILSEQRTSGKSGILQSCEKTKTKSMKSQISSTQRVSIALAPGKKLLSSKE